MSPETAKDPDYKAAFDAYLTVLGSKPHIEPKPGGNNEACQGGSESARDPYENPRSTGVVIRYGKFRLLDLGDLGGQPLFNLACPKSMIGLVDAYLVAHHGGPDADVLETFGAFAPRVAIMNNGTKKGGALATYQGLHQASGLENVWQLHRSDDAGDSNFDAEYVANLDEGTSHWLKLSARRDGSFRVFNQRTGESKSYAPRSR
jgi:competence protein ComEC